MYCIAYIKGYLSHLIDLDQKKQFRKRKKSDEKSTARPQATKKRKATDTDSESITEDSEHEVENYDSEDSEDDLVLNAGTFATDPVCCAV